MIRAAGVALVVYSLFGLALLGLGWVVGTRALAELDAARASLEGQRVALVDSLRSTSQALETAARAFDGFGGALVEAERSARRAAAVAHDSSQAAGSLAQASSLQILGFQPLLPLVPGFERAADGLVRLGGDLEATADAMTSNGDGLRGTSQSLSDARARVDALADAFAATPLLGGPGDALRIFRLALYGLLLWILGQALFAGILGAWLIRHATQRLRAYSAARVVSLPGSGSAAAIAVGDDASDAGAMSEEGKRIGRV